MSERSAVLRGEFYVDGVKKQVLRVGNELVIPNPLRRDVEGGYVVVEPDGSGAYKTTKRVVSTGPLAVRVHPKYKRSE